MRRNEASRLYAVCFQQMKDSANKGRGRERLLLRLASTRTGGIFGMGWSVRCGSLWASRVQTVDVFLLSEGLKSHTLP